MNRMITWALVDMHTVLVRKPEEMRTLEIPNHY